MRTLHEKPWSHDVISDEATGTYFIDVVCGGSAMYTLRVKLTPEEIAGFLADANAWTRSRVRSLHILASLRIAP